jgi:uncharacterized glyoxalase superfamily protein PhnB
MSGPTIISSLIYADAEAGIKWLTEVLGLTLKSFYKMPDGKVAFAELVWRTGIVFVSSRPSEDNPWSRVGVASIALVAEDANSVSERYKHVCATDADIVRALHVARTPAFPDGSTQFDVRDPEGNLWTMGTFQPTFSSMNVGKPA